MDSGKSDVLIPEIMTSLSTSLWVPELFICRVFADGPSRMMSRPFSNTRSTMASAGLTIDSLRFHSFFSPSTDGMTLQGDSIVPKQSHTCGFRKIWRVYQSYHPEPRCLQDALSLLRARPGRLCALSPGYGPRLPPQGLCRATHRPMCKGGSNMDQVLIGPLFLS